MATTPTQILGIPMDSPSVPPFSTVICLLDKWKFPNGLSLFIISNTYSSDDLRMMLVSYKSDWVNAPSKLTSTGVGETIREDYSNYDKIYP